MFLNYSHENLDKIIEDFCKKAAYKGDEFKYLERICQDNDINFTQGIIDGCLDLYTKYFKKYDNSAVAKYVSLVETSHEITQEALQRDIDIGLFDEEYEEFEY